MIDDHQPEIAPTPCGHAAPADAHFCPHCGLPLPPGEAPAVDETGGTAQDPGRRRRSPRRTLIGAVAAVLIVVVGAGAGAVLLLGGRQVPAPVADQSRLGGFTLTNPVTHRAVRTDPWADGAPAADVDICAAAYQVYTDAHAVGQVESDAYGTDYGARYDRSQVAADTRRFDVEAASSASPAAKQFQLAANLFTLDDQFVSPTVAAAGLLSDMGNYCRYPTNRRAPQLTRPTEISIPGFPSPGSPTTTTVPTIPDVPPVAATSGPGRTPAS